MKATLLFLTLSIGILVFSATSQSEAIPVERAAPYVHTESYRNERDGRFSFLTFQGVRESEMSASIDSPLSEFSHYYHRAIAAYTFNASQRGAAFCGVHDRSLYGVEVDAAPDTFALAMSESFPADLASGTAPDFDSTGRDTFIISTSGTIYCGVRDPAEVLAQQIAAEASSEPQQPIVTPYTKHLNQFVSGRVDSDSYENVGTIFSHDDVEAVEIDPNWSCVPE